MKEILKILKKHLPKIGFIIIFLVLLANCDLALPSYTSNIVNVGIQQNGIEYASPIVMREETYNELKMFMSDKQDILDNYTKISKSNLESKKYNEYVKLYPALKNESLYILENVNNDTLSSIEKEISTPLSILSAMEQMKSMNTSKTTPNIPSNISIDTIKAKMESMGESVVKQYAINRVKEEYKAVGLDIEKVQMKYIAKTGLKMLGITLVSALITICNSYLISRLSSAFAKELRSKVVKKVMSFSNEEFESLSASSLITRTTNDIQQIQMLIVMLMRVVVYAPIIGIGAFLKVKDSSMAWVIGVALVAILAVILVLFFVAVPNFKKVQELLDRVNLVSREILTGLPVIRAFATEKYEEKRFDKANKDLTKVNLFVNKVMSVMMPTMMFIMNAICILIIWVGADRIDNATIQIGDLMALIQYSMQIIMAFLMISMVSIMMPRALVSIKRIAEVLNKEVTVKDPIKPKKFNEKTKGKVEFRDVYFRYPDAEEDVLRNINFTANKGETVAFIGSTGSGKSTLINLVARFFDVTGGKILVDECDIKDVKIKDLREKIGFVPQKGVLFSGTIASNLKLGNEKLSKEEMKHVAQISQALEFIDKKEDGFDSPISQGGTNVSGGQKQRLAIARAIAKNPEIYIFDDSFSALDFKTDAKLRKALKEYTKDSTILIVAQRISSIMNADKIIVLEQGEIVGMGTHNKLLKNCEVYKEIASSQLGEEEIKNA